MQNSKMVVIAIIAVSILVYNSVLNTNPPELTHSMNPQTAGNTAGYTAGNSNSLLFDKYDKLTTALQSKQLDDQQQRVFTLEQQTKMNKILNDIETGLILVENSTEQITDNNTTLEKSSDTVKSVVNLLNSNE